MTTYSDIVRLPSGDDSIAPVTILDAEGRVLRVVSAEEFRRARPSATAESLGDHRPVISMRAKRALRRVADSRLISAAAPAPQSAVAS
jgi:hypothetical protein